MHDIVSARVAPQPDLPSRLQVLDRNQRLGHRSEVFESGIMEPNSIEEVGSWIDIDFMRIPKGWFVMGSKDENELAWDDEKPQHTLEIPYDYWIGKHPVTNARFGAFVRSTAFETRAEREGWGWVWDTRREQWGKVEGANWRNPLGANKNVAALEAHPVVQVCWYDALVFCEWLNQKQINNLPHGYHFRLPNEAEWEKSARGVDGHEWPWGNAFDAALCNSRDDGEFRTTPVGAHSPQGNSTYGVADMSGNVWEWTLTLWGTDRDNPDYVYPYFGGDGRENQSAGDGYFRIIRGGSFKDDIGGVRCACRDLDPPYYSLNNLGFRVVCSPNSGEVRRGPIATGGMCAQAESRE
jgi:formylglycine-generating enzyme required for sulfatase activity